MTKSGPGTRYYCAEFCGMRPWEKWQEIAVFRLGLIGGSLNPEAEIIWRISQLGPAVVKFIFVICYIIQSTWDHCCGGTLQFVGNLANKACY